MKLPYSGAPHGGGMAAFLKRDKARVDSYLTDNERSDRKFISGSIQGAKGVQFMGQVRPQPKPPSPKEPGVVGAVDRSTNQIFLASFSKGTHGVVWTAYSKPCTPKIIPPPPEPDPIYRDVGRPTKYILPPKVIDF